MISLREYVKHNQVDFTSDKYVIKLFVTHLTLDVGDNTNAGVREGLRWNTNEGEALL